MEGGKVVEVSRIEQGGIRRGAKRLIGAEGRLLTPGFVDIHTHYDGQVCWDKQVTPEWHLF